MEQEEFFNRCAYLLGVRHEYREPIPVPKTPGRDGLMRMTGQNRWNGRQAGNGRFVGSGLIRCFGSIIHVALTTPPLTGQFQTYEAVLEAIEAAMKAYEERVAVITREENDAALKQNPAGYRLATSEERDMCERLTRRAHMEIEELLKDRKPRFIDRKGAPAASYRR